MTRHLMLVSIGPVQDFIAAARRTRDLWFGSHLLSEIARGAALTAANGGARLIFPALDKGDEELNTCQKPLRERTNKPPLNIANKLLIELPTEIEDPAVFAKQLRQGARATWIGLADDAKESAKDALRADVDGAWREQIESLLEFNAVWLPLDDYKETHDALEKALAARKNIKEFAPWNHDKGGLPKSSLDGARMSLLRDDAHKRGARRLRLTAGEELDAVGLVKRAGGEPEQFIPLVNVAYASWMERAQANRPAEFEALRDAVGELYSALGENKLRRSDLDWVRRFPYDAHMVSVDREAALREEWLGGEGSETTEACFAAVFDAARALVRKAGQPHPYVACLLADGDKMGEALNKLHDAEAHRTFSKNLADFASKARELVEQRHKGFLVYAGGDDVLAFVALEDAVDCAEALKKLFEATMVDALKDHDVTLPTLSVGLGVGHMLESMGHLRHLASKAEKLAKGDKIKDERQRRNALAIVLDKRSGNTIEWRARWSEDPASRINAALGYLGDDSSLSSKKVYQVRALLDQLPDPDKVTLSGGELKEAADVLFAEVRRVLGRSNLERGEPLRPDEVGLMLDVSKGLKALRDEVDQWVTRMLIARTIADAKGRAALANMAEVGND
jgi:CRISPR-associated protein Cmr2